MFILSRVISIWDFVVSIDTANIVFFFDKQLILSIKNIGTMFFNTLTRPFILNTHLCHGNTCQTVSIETDSI